MKPSESAQADREIKAKTRRVLGVIVAARFVLCGGEICTTVARASVTPMTEVGAHLNGSATPTITCEL
jgi:hypothetical protein